jgi:hypothetical protein
MTAYFDTAGERLSIAIRTRASNAMALAAELDEIDFKLVEDVSICSEFPEFPDDLREGLHRTILRWSAAGQPVNATGPCYETPQEHAYGIGNLISGLHTIFHELAERRLTGFSDDPRTPLRILYSRAEERREGLVGPTDP